MGGRADGGAGMRGTQVAGRAREAVEGQGGQTLLRLTSYFEKALRLCDGHVHIGGGRVPAGPVPLWFESAQAAVVQTLWGLWANGPPVVRSPAMFTRLPDAAAGDDPTRRGGALGGGLSALERADVVGEPKQLDLATSIGRIANELRVI
jgi:hypothetical protein